MVQGACSVRRRLSESMAVSEKVRFRFDQMLGRISEIPNVALAEKDGLDARLTIREHPPLDSAPPCLGGRSVPARRLIYAAQLPSLWQPP